MNNSNSSLSFFSFKLSAMPVLILFLLIAPGIMGINFIPPAKKKYKPGYIRMVFKNTVDGAALVMNDSVYTNVFGENYRVSKLKYYISNPGLKNSILLQKEKNGYHLVDASAPASQSFIFAVRPGEYHSVFFLMGVDSAHNCSGAQTGALDPLHDMFWTWNNGYVMVKLEGLSPVSPAINQRMEYHIGGYKGRDKVLEEISLIAPSPIVIKAEKTTEVIIETDISKWWQFGNPVPIKGTPICATPGQMAKKIAENYRNMFSLLPGSIIK